jgi:lipopolysaccharide/colanic/teichoic acid biosynthesis glycosyltransferase
MATGHQPSFCHEVFSHSHTAAVRTVVPVAEPRPAVIRRIRKAPDRAFSRAELQLAAGREIVGGAGNLSPWYLGVKRGLDVLGALFLLLAFSPIMLTAYLVLMVTTRGKPIFRQERLGYRGRPFTMYKFRTMYLDAARRQHEVKNEKDGPIFKNRRDPRVTPLGRILRSTSIDEMPQLVNVLLGHMSLVGPRPPVRSEVAQYRAWQRRRLAVKPGLTCLWQVSGRSEIGFERWVRMDLWYVNRQSLRTDLGLLAKTPQSVLSRRGAY